MYAEKMGEIVTDRLIENFTGFMDYGFTAKARRPSSTLSPPATRTGKEVLDEFYGVQAT